MSKNILILLISSLIISFSFQSCDLNPFINSKDIITEEDEAIIGGTVDTALQSHFQAIHTPVLSQDTYAFAHNYIYNLRNTIAGTAYFSELPTIRIVDNSSLKTAFVAPGGYIYLHKGFLLALDYESQFVGALSCLMACSENDKALQKLENTFSKAYLIDLALGGNIDNTPAVLTELRDIPYDSIWVNSFDEKSISILCSEDYNIQGYADLFLLQSNLDWMQLFPRSNNFGATLFNRKNTTDCGGETDNQSAYTDMKNSL